MSLSLSVIFRFNCGYNPLWQQLEGEEGILPTKIQKLIWDNATKFEREFQS